MVIGAISSVVGEYGHILFHARLKDLKGLRGKSQRGITMNERRKIAKAMEKKAAYGQFTTNNSVQGGWFIWLYDAVEVTQQFLKKERERVKP